MLYPLTFRPILKERIWGGRNLETLYGKALPKAARIGESWEISDRPGDESIIDNGPLQGKTLHWLLRNHGAEMLGPGRSIPARFPLLIKILDAQDTLSLQVHPPPHKAAELLGEPKTEMWYIAQAGPDAELFVGLKRGITRRDFEEQLARQTVQDCFHRIAVRAGDAMFLPSGRVHALGAKNVIFEIQQNSDTTYRVFDWNRVDAKGKSRELHIDQSLASIDFTDIEPSLLPRNTISGNPGTIRPLVKNELFEVSLRRMDSEEKLSLPSGRMKILGVTEGAMQLGDIHLGAGQFCLIPAQCPSCSVRAKSAVSFLQIYATA